MRPAAAAALKAGDIQVLDAISPTELAGVQQTSSLRVLRANGLGWRGIVINIGNRNGVGNLPYANVGTPLASSAKLRQAFEEAIDRDALNRVVFGGTTQAGCTPDLAGEPDWYDASIPCTPYDPQRREEARRRVGLLEPDRAPADAERDRQLSAGAVHPGAGGGGRDQRRHRPGRHRDQLVARTSGNFDTALAGPASGADTDRQHLRLVRDARGRGTTAATRTRGST